MTLSSKTQNTKSGSRKKAEGAHKDREATGFPVVGIGASAGGLDAFKKFFKAMPPESGMAFVLIQHLDPNHESLTADLLARHTAMKVAQIEDGVPVEPNQVYVIPPNKDLAIFINIKPSHYSGIQSGFNNVPSFSTLKL